MNNQKGIIWLPILIMVVAVAAFSAMAYLVWQKNVRSTETTDLTKPPVEHVVKNVNINSSTNTSAASEDTKALADADLAAKWATYINDVFGVSVQYPSTWKTETPQGRNSESGTSAVGNAWFFRPGPDGDVATGSPTVFLDFLSNPDNKTLGELLDQDYENCVASPGGTEEICINSKAISTWTASTISGHDILRSGLLRLAAGSPSSVIEKDFLYVKTDGGYLVLDAFPEPGYETVIDRIITSLRFVDAQKTWVTYENKELGFSFQYPSVFGTAAFSEKPGDTGKIFSISFDNETTPLKLGGMTKDYTAGTEGSFFTTQGYILDKGGYYNTFVAGRDYIDYPLQPFKVVSVSGQTVLLLDQESLVYQRNKDPNSSYPPTLGETRLGALANFSKKSDYRGMGILDYNTALVPSSTFEAILSTFQFTPTP